MSADAGDPNREFAEYSTVVDGEDAVVIYDTSNPHAWVQSTQAIKLSNYPR